MDSKILTIIVPTYNMEKYLQKCLNSLIVPIEQMRKLEVLIINDGSTDNSSAIAHEYQDKHPDTFRVIDKENGNYGSCVNRGLKEAKGKYIKLLDADDHFEPKGFNVFLEKLLKIHVDLILSDFVMQDIGGRSLSYKKYNLEPQKIMNFHDICLASTFKNLQMHGICYNRELLLKIKYKQTEGISYTDTEWKYKPLASVNTVYYINTVVYCYLVGRAGQTTKNYKNSVNQLLEVAYSNLNFLLAIDKKTNSNIRKYLSTELKYIIGMVYYYGIVFHGLNNDKLIKFDRFIKSCNWQFYHDLPPISIKIWKYQYIKKWRRNPISYTMPKLIRMLLVIQCLKRQFKSLIISRLKFRKVECIIL